MAKGEVSKLWIFLGLKSELGKSIAKEMQAVNRSFKHLDYISKQLIATGKTLTTSVTLPIAAMAVATVSAANKMDEAMDSIRVGTGATGRELESLGKVLRSTLKQVPNDAGQAAQAIADLNTRLGLTGKPLETLTQQVLNLSRITKTEVAPLIASVTRVFGDWSISTENQSKALDYLFKVSQQTGISIDRLGSLVVQYGAPLRQMGFSFEHAAALMGKFEKEGVNLELVMGSLRIALGKMAREGITDTAKALAIITERIKEAGTVGEANALALEYFGARAGPDMAAAIREGRFEIDALIKSLTASNETINRAASDTLSLSEKFQILKNRVTLALEPIGVRLIEAFDMAMPAIQSAIEWVANLADRFANLPTGMQTTILAIIGVTAALGPLLIVFGQAIQVIKAVSLALRFLQGHPIFLAISLLVAAIYLVIEHWDKMKSAAKVAWDAILGYMQPVIDFIESIIEKIKDAIAWFGRLFGLSGTSSTPVLPEGSYSTPEAPAMAEGGIVTRPTYALIGERGPEAVIPLGERISLDVDYEKLAASIVIALRQYPQIINNNYSSPNLRQARLAYGG